MSGDIIKVARKMLPREEEFELFEKWFEARSNGSRRLEDQLFSKIIIQFSPIVHKMVKKMKGYRIDKQDMISEGLLGLTRAANNFDPSLGLRFGTYASNCVMNTLFTYVTKQYSITNACSSGKNKKLFFSLRRIMSEQIQLSGDTNMTPELIQNVANEIGVTVDDVKAMNHILHEPYQSLNETAGNDDEDDSMSRQDMVESREINQEEQLEVTQLEALRNQILSDAIQTLDTRAQYIITEQTLRDDNDTLTLEVLGKKFGISKERARQIKEKAKTDINTYFTKVLKDKNIDVSDLFN